MSERATPRYGIVTSYDPDAYAVKVMRQPEDSETGWIPLSTAWAGNGWGMFAPPVPGAQVKLGFQEDGKETALVEGQYFSDEDLPIVPEIGGAPAGEFWLVHETGTRLRFQNDSTFEIQHKEKGLFRMLPDNTIETIHKDGAYFRMSPDATVTLTHKDSSFLRFTPVADIELHHKNGSRMTFREDGSVEIVQISGSRIVMQRAGGIEITHYSGSNVELKNDGTVQLRGTQIEAGGVGSPTLRLMTEHFVSIYNSHVHGNGPTPTPQITDGQITKTFRAG